MATTLAKTLKHNYSSPHILIHQNELLKCHLMFLKLKINILYISFHLQLFTHKSDTHGNLPNFQ